MVVLKTPGQGAPPPPPGGGGAQYPKGITGGAVPVAPYQPGGVPPNTTPYGPAPVDPAGPPGADQYDWYRINDALRASQMSGWQIAGTSHQPTNVGTTVKNPAYDPVTNPDVEEFVVRPSADYVIGVVNPSTGQLVKLHLSRSQPDASGQYSYSITGRDDQGKLDKDQPGYTGVQRLPFADGREELWGTNSATGVFEKMPGNPTDLGNKAKGWNDIKQIETPDGKLIWMGTPPEGGPPKPVPGMENLTVNTSPYVTGSVRQVTKDGQVVYVGQRKDNGAIETIAGYGAETKPIETKTVGGTTYKQNPSAGQPGQPDFVPVTGLAQAKEGDEQWVPVSGGYLGKQTYHNGNWSYDPNEQPRPYDPALSRAAGAIKPAGTRYEVPMTVNGQTRLVEVVADGNGSYTVPSDTKSRTFPGTPPNTIAQQPGTTEPFMVRYNADTNQYSREPNPNYQPKDVAGQVTQLSNMASAKLQELQGKIGPAYTPEQAQAEYDQWWAANIDTQKQQLLQQQQDEKLARQMKIDEQQRQNLGTAQTAGADVVRAVAGEHRVGPGFGDFMANMNNAVATKSFPQQMNAQQFNNAFVTPMPDYQNIYEQATAKALAHISPTAAQIAGQSTPTALAGGVDINSQLNRTNFNFNPAQLQTAPQVGPGPQPQPAPQVGPAPMPTPANVLPGQNYGAATGFSGGVMPWNFDWSTYRPGAYQPTY